MQRYKTGHDTNFASKFSSETSPLCWISAKILYVCM